MLQAQRRGGSAGILVAAGLTSVLAPVSASFLLVALPDLQHGLAVDSVAAGMAVTAYFVLMVVGQPVGGRLGDRCGRVRTLRAGTVLLVIASMFGAIASDYRLVLGARLAQALAGSLAFPNAFAVIRDAVPMARRGRALGALGAAIVVSSAAAIPLGQLVVHFGGWRSTFLATAVLALLAYLLQTAAPRAVVPGGAVGADADATRARASLADERPRDVVDAVLSLGAVNAAMYAFVVAVALGAAGQASRSLILFTFLASSAIGAALGGRAADQVGRGTTASAGLTSMLLGLAMVLRPTVTPGWIISVGTLVAGLGVGACMTSLQTVAADRSSATSSGRIAGWLASARYLGAAVGSFAGSMFAIHQLGGENLAFITAVIGVLVASAAAAGMIRTETLQVVSNARAVADAFVRAGRHRLLYRDQLARIDLANHVLEHGAAQQTHRAAHVRLAGEGFDTGCRLARSGASVDHWQSSCDERPLCQRRV